MLVLMALLPPEISQTRDVLFVDCSVLCHACLPSSLRTHSHIVHRYTVTFFDVYTNSVVTSSLHRESLLRKQTHPQLDGTIAARNGPTITKHMTYHSLTALPCVSAIICTRIIHSNTSTIFDLMVSFLHLTFILTKVEREGLLLWQTKPRFDGPIAARNGPTMAKQVTYRLLPAPPCVSAFLRSDPPPPPMIGEARSSSVRP